MLLDIRKPGDEIRVDAARELGHLLLHNRAAPAGRKAQQLAIGFAHAFLMPPSSFKGSLAEALSPRLTAGRRHWGVPRSTFLHRLHELGELSDWQYRRLGIDDPGAGFQDVDDTPRHPVPEILRAVFAALRRRDITPRSPARELNLYLKDVDEFVFGLASALLHKEISFEGQHHELTPRLVLVE